MILSPKRQISAYLTLKFPVTFDRGKNYILLLYNSDSNNILVIPMKVRTDKYFLQVVNDQHEHLLISGLKPTYMWLGNDASPAFQ